MPRVLKAILNDTPRSKDYAMFEISEVYPTINTAPPYQRRPRHSQKKMGSILNHIMQRGFFLPIILYRYQPDEKNRGFEFECVDGQHRLFVISNFLAGRPVTVKGKTFMLTWDYEDEETHHVTHVFYEENDFTKQWIMSHKDQEYSYMDASEKKRFNQFRLPAWIFEERMTPDQRRITFLRLQEGVPVRNSDLYKNYTHLKFISFTTDFMGWSSRMTECIETNLTIRPIDYWLPWLIRLYLIHTQDDCEEAFMTLDSKIVGMIKDNSPQLNQEVTDEFKTDVEDFFEFMEDLPPDVKLDPCQFYALFTKLISLNSDERSILKAKMPRWKGEKRYANLWQKDSKRYKMAERRGYYVACIEQIDDLINVKPLSQPMTRDAYRKHLTDIGRPVESDQDICHIIAAANGGADHSDNYIVLSSTLNRSIGNRNDAYFAKHAGLDATKKAVLVSRIMNGYKGPSAEQLCM